MAKTAGKGKASGFRGPVSTEPETDLDDSSVDESAEEELLAPEDDESFSDTADELRSGSSVLAHTDMPSEIRHIEVRPRTVHIPEWMMGNFFTRYAAESFVELYSNTTWPTWREAWNFTFIVIVMAIVIAVILGIADLGLTQVLNWFVHLGK